MTTQNVSSALATQNCVDAIWSYTGLGENVQRITLRAFAFRFLYLAIICILLIVMVSLWDFKAPFELTGSL